MSTKNTNTPPRPMRPGFGPGPHGMMPGDKAKDFRGTIGKLMIYLGKYKWTILVVWTLAVASTVFSILGPKVLGTATDELFTGLTRYQVPVYRSLFSNRPDRPGYQKEVF
jgi:ATP-binding cassette subfamily B protein